MSLDDHAQVTRDGFKVPLLTVPKSSVLEECDLCHDEKSMRVIELNADGNQWLCMKCRVAMAFHKLKEDSFP